MEMGRIKMLISYFRSSSLGTWNMCQMKYYICYVLGIQEGSNLKADKGTIVHKVLEDLAIIKKHLQDNPDSKSIVIDDEEFDITDFMKPYQLSNEEVEKVNKTRINKEKYVNQNDCKIKNGHVRHGVELVEILIRKSYDYYSNRTKHNWKPIDFKDCTNWTWMALDFKNGVIDPRRRNIVQPEANFKLIIEKDWAKFEHVLPNGEYQEGYLEYKGTIDLVTDVNDSTYEVIDWKTGSRIDWASNARDFKDKIKTYEKLCSDRQLMLYYYACKRLYPDVDDVMLTINFIRDGGPFTICFEGEHYHKAEQILKDTFIEIKNCTRPRMVFPRQNEMKCRMCGYFKEGNICQQINADFELYDIDAVTDKWQEPGFDISYYSAPGA
jgi:hypothetical protein